MAGSRRSVGAELGGREAALRAGDGGAVPLVPAEPGLPVRSRHPSRLACGCCMMGFSQQGRHLAWLTRMAHFRRHARDRGRAAPAALEARACESLWLRLCVDRCASGVPCSDHYVQVARNSQASCLVPSNQHTGRVLTQDRYRTDTTHQARDAALQATGLGWQRLPSRTTSRSRPRPPQPLLQTAADRDGPKASFCGPAWPWR